MRGHIRRRGEGSFEYIVDIGSAAAQRCQACKRRFWVERKPKERCAKCGGELAETEERRRAIKGGYATRRECEAALAKVLAALETRSFTPPTKVTLKQFLLFEWLPTVKGSLRPTTYASYEMLAKEHIIPRLGALQLQKLTPGAINALYAHLQSTAASTAAGRSRSPRYAASTPCCTRPVTTPCAGDGSASTRWLARIRPRQLPNTATGCASGARSNLRPFSATSQTIVSLPSGDCWPQPACAGERPSALAGRTSTWRQAR